MARDELVQAAIRDELVQAAIEALDDVNFWLDDCATDADANRLVSNVAEIVVDAVLAKLGD